MTSFVTIKGVIEDVLERDAIGEPYRVIVEVDLEDIEDDIERYARVDLGYIHESDCEECEECDCSLEDYWESDLIEHLHYRGYEVKDPNKFGESLRENMAINELHNNLESGKISIADLEEFNKKFQDVG